jgi:hypothetical protein
MFTSLRGGPVAIRIARLEDRARRLVFDEAAPAQMRHEWRCARCAGWVPDEAVTWIASGKRLADAPEMFAYCEYCEYCEPCSATPFRRLRR